jgi:hypothetical protein
MSDSARLESLAAAFLFGIIRDLLYNFGKKKYERAKKKKTPAQ